MSESVRVAVRCRPLNHKESQHRCKSVIAIDPQARSCSLLDNDGTGTGKIYQFDATFGPDANTETVYEEVGSYVVEAVLDGYNGTVFAYGQTGCGKSHTMRGIIERALEHLFEATSTASSDTRYLALLTYLEIYNEKLRDLLEIGSNADGENQLQLKEDPVRGTYVAGGLREVTVKDARECARLVELGDKKRAAAATKMNAASSRSHAVLTISLEAIAIGSGSAVDGGGAVRRGRLHLVDLAGSERQRRTGATGDRLKEAASINLSLSALGNVISALAAGNGRHVPYRDSKLTRLLRDSLGGNARTLMIACISPSDADAEETLSTLRYAARARCIKNKPVINEDPKDALLRQYQIELQRLRKLLESSGGTDGDETTITSSTTTTTTTRNDDVVNGSGDGNGFGGEVQIEVIKIDSPSPELITDVKPIEQPSSTHDIADERRRKKREAAKQDVLRRLERLTIGGEALGDIEIQRRRERRRKRLRVLAEALERSSQEGNGCAFEVYGQLKSTEDALKRMARKAKQLEAEAADLQASWDEERRELLKRELLTQQLCEAMLPHLRPGCPLRDLAWARDASTWSTELGRWRLPDITGQNLVSLPPAHNNSTPPPPPSQSENPKSDHNNNGGGNCNGSDGGANGRISGRSSRNFNNDDDEDDDDDDDDVYGVVDGNEMLESTRRRDNIADVYFKRNRIDKILAHVREAKTFDVGARLSKSGSSSEELHQQAQLTPIASAHHHHHHHHHRHQLDSLGPENWRPKIGGWLDQQDQDTGGKKFQGGVTLASLPKRNHLQPPPRLLEALPAYPQITTSATIPQQRMPGPIL